MKRKYMNTDKIQWKEPELTTLTLSVKWVVAQICKASQLAFYIIKRSRRIELIPSAESPLPTFDLNVFAQGLCAASKRQLK